MRKQGGKMGMEIQDMPQEAPDTYGLPEYCHLTEMRSEIDGRDIRMVFGHRRFGQIQWLYTVVVSPEATMKLCRECMAVAEEAFNLTQMMDRRRSGH
jgi:hypothetical protein